MILKLSILDLPEPLSVRKVTKEQFINTLQPLGKPVVMRGFGDDWDIVKAAKENKSDMLGYLQKHAANLEQKVPVTRIPATEKSRMFYNSDMTAMNFGVAELPLQICLERMALKSDDAQYAAQCVSIDKVFSALSNKIKNPFVSNTLSPFIWFGNRVIVAPHFDESNNIAVVAAGKRRFTLFPPEQVKNLYVGPLDFTPAGQAISLVNILEPNLQLHPQYAEAYQSGLSVELAPGDAIFIPTPWWHHVQSLSDFNILINYWWNECDTGTAKPLAALLHAIQAFKALPPAQRDGFKAMLEHYVFDETENSHEHIPEHAKGWLGKLTQERRKELDHFIKVFSN